MLKQLKELVFIPKCKRCHKIAEKDNLCAECRADLEKCRIKNPSLPINKKVTLVDEIYASYRYENCARDIVVSAKFQNPARFLNSLLADISIDIKEILSQNNIDMVVSVPSHKSKFYTQEFDLPTEMAKRIADGLSVEYSPCVIKTKKTKKQHNLPLDQRKVNLVNVFTVNKNLTGRNVLIIDDVITTGHTVSAVATELKLAGRNKVYAWVYTLNT